VQIQTKIDQECRRAFVSLYTELYDALADPFNGLVEELSLVRTPDHLRALLGT
jgi:hypothetical protein